MSLTVLLFLTTTLTAVDPAAAEANKKELEKLQGSWLLQSKQEEGQDEKLRDQDRVSLTIAGTRITIKEEKEYKGTIAIDAGKKPAAIDLIPTEEGEKGKLLGIYQVEGDTLKLCYGRPGVPRPTEFTTKANSKQVLMVFKKQ